MSCRVHDRGRSFFVNILKSDAYKLGLYTNLEFQLVQHSRDESLIRSLVNYFGCGNFYIRQGKDFLSFRCTKFSDIENRIIPFFQEYNILGVKAKDF